MSRVLRRGPCLRAALWLWGAGRRRRSLTEGGVPHRPWQPPASQHAPLAPACSEELLPCVARFKK